MKTSLENFGSLRRVGAGYTQKQSQSRFEIVLPIFTRPKTGENVQSFPSQYKHSVESRSSRVFD